MTIISLTKMDPSFLFRIDFIGVIMLGIVSTLKAALEAMLVTQKCF